MTYVVALTGGIGSGKSAVADLFAAHGAVVVDTDAIAHELTGAGGKAMPEILRVFGPTAATAEGALDRAAMRRLIFADPEARKRLEAILHPMIREESERRIVTSASLCRNGSAVLLDTASHNLCGPSAYAVLVVPLLIESGSYRERCDRIAVVDCSEETQIRRVMARNGMKREEILRILAAQASRQQRLAAADDVIANETGLAALARQVDALDARYRSNRGVKPQKG